jgi:hypothetical protein
MIIDPELLRVLAEQHREELHRSMERSRSFQARYAADALRHPIRTIMAPLRPARRQAWWPGGSGATR